jgi:two-component system NtrC family sensor kinase
MWFYSTRSKLIGSFLAIAIITGFVSLLVGTYLLYRSVLREAKNHVRLNLNAAKEIYRTKINSIASPLTIASLGPGFRSALQERKIPELISRLDSIAEHTDLDFLGLVTEEGKTLCRIGSNPLHSETAEIANPVAALVLDRMVPISGTVVLSRQFLYAESPELAEQARIRLIPTNRTTKVAAGEETSGMALAFGMPVFDRDDLIGVLYGGILLNQSQTIVDTVRDTVFQLEIYKGRNVGTATIFLNDLRISTNVLTSGGKRAIGTRAMKKVKDCVFTEGKTWTDRAFVLSDRYITAYEPIEDIFGNRVGMISVAVLEAKYADIWKKVLLVLMLITVAGMIFAVGLGYILADKIMKPVHQLIKASRQVSEGSLMPDIGPISKDKELSVLQNTFKDMVAAMGRRRKEAQSQLFRSERQASIGRLAAGVAHEINNPLTGVLTFSHMLLRRKDIGDDIRSDLETIAKSTERVRKIVKGLLDFSRQTKLDREPTEINRLISSTISLMENQALIKGVSIKFNPGENLPTFTLDRSQFQSVLLNMIINAIDATEPGGSINVYTATGLSASDTGHKGIEITIADTGCGISPENLDRLFDPFFSTKEVGEGTGLGLAVSYGIVRRHGGTIRVQSEVGKGTRFFIWLPI